jgi:hypothetical membrane protein
MTLTLATEPVSGVRPSAKAARITIGAAVVYHVVLLALIPLRPDLDPSWHTISEWAIGPHGWVMTMAFLVSGVSYAFLFLLLRAHLRDWLGRIGLAIIAVCVVGTFGVGVFTTDPPPFFDSMSIVGTLHVVCGTSALFLLPFGALLTNMSLALKNPSWLPVRRPLLWTAGLPLIGLATFMTYTAVFVVPLGPGAYGPGVHVGWPPRFAFFTYMIWLVTLALQAIKLSRPSAAVEERHRATAQVT